MSTETQTLAERITSVLVAAGFREYEGPDRPTPPGGAFTVSAGVGVIVGTAWLDAPPDERAALLTRMENRLLVARLSVTNRGNCLYVAEPDEITEYATQMSGGGFHVRADDPEIEEIYPLAKWIPSQQRFGGKVYRRRIFVVEDWEEV